MRYIATEKAPKAIGAYSQGVMHGDTLYVSGQIPFVPETMTLVSDDIKEQTRQSLENILAIVEAAGLKKENIIRCQLFLTDLGDFEAVNNVYMDFFGDHKPARAAVEVSALPKNVNIEIDAIAVKT